MSSLRFDCRFRYPSGFALDFAFSTTAPITALCGPSGAGKTTTLHLIAGLLRPASGTIALDNRVLFDDGQRINIPVHARRIGLVFQDYQLFPHLTVAGNLHYGHRRAPRSSFDLKHLVEVLDLGPLLTRSPTTLSGGQRQRVALGRALASNPALLLLDEPVSALDDALKASVLEYVTRIHREYATPLLLVTHDLAMANQLGAEIVCLPIASG